MKKPDPCAKTRSKVPPMGCLRKRVMRARRCKAPQDTARQARASNETLYSWYGDKQGLFKALVTRNAAKVKALLEAELSSERDAPPWDGQPA